MERTTISQEELQRRVDKLIAIRTGFKDETIRLGERMLEHTITFTDIFTCEVANSMMRLSRSLSRYIDEKEFISATAIIRMMVDTLLTYYGGWQVDNPHDFAMSIMDDEEISKTDGRDGKPLRYSTLARKLDAELGENIYDIYKHTCAGIHFSGLHMRSTLAMEVKENGVEYITGRLTDENAHPMTLSQTADMLYCENRVCTCFLSLMKNYVDTKP